MTKHKFDEQKYLQDILKESQEFSAKLKALQNKLNEIEQLSPAQKVVYDGLDDQINNTLVDLNKAFENLKNELKSERPVDLKYHLTRIRTLSKEGLEDVNKAIDITKGTKFEGAGFFDDIKRAFTHLKQWASKKLGQIAGHELQLQDAQQLKGAINAPIKNGLFSKTSIKKELEKVKDEVGITLHETGHTVVNRQRELLGKDREQERERPRRK